MPLLRINMFGKLTLTCINNSISESDNRSKKLWKVLEYIIANRDRMISSNELSKIINPEDSGTQTNPSIIKTTIHRVRSMLDNLKYISGHRIILQRSGMYFWNKAIETEIDTVEFSKIYQQVKTDISNSRKILNLKRAMSLYNGFYLSSNSKEDWVVDDSEKYHRQYQELLQLYFELLMPQKRYDDIIEVAQKAVSIDPCREIFHYILIRAYAEKGDHQRALILYDNVISLFYGKFRINPSDKFRALYKSIIKSSNAFETDINTVYTNIANNVPQHNVIQCEYDCFKDIFSFFLSCHHDVPTPAVIILFSLSSSDELVIKQTRLDSALTVLKTFIERYISYKCVYSRYSMTQFVALIPCLPPDIRNDIITQIHEEYNKNEISKHVLLSISAKDILAG